MRHSVNIRTSKTTAEVLQTITAATAQEMVHEGTLRRSQKPFVCEVFGNKFRILQTPPRRRPGDRCNRYFRGEVREVNGERHIVGSFAFHPFHFVVASIPVAVVALIFLMDIKGAWKYVFIAGWAAFDFIYLASLRRKGRLEENRIVAFLDSLFVEPDSAGSDSRTESFT